MVSTFDVHPTRLIVEVSAALKNVDAVKAPETVRFVKSGAHAQRPPAHPDFWFIRAASVLRTIYKDGPVGVSKLRTKYGGRKNMGVRPEKFKKGGGAIIRRILVQLEQAGLVKKEVKGRVITPAGASLLDKSAAKLARTQKPAQ
ncbi:30S ribosomal protein S19e [archaeon CG10_big_fil_rev_8_21_14_0_10_43_11]|nr:MAG: 30S ribosomal protein S19e [archaeon CG10_big_fil_rev_8_21_14_0_10_43_11]